MKTFRFIFLLLPHLLSAHISPSSISSKKASYDGNTLLLKGSVQVEHTLGKMCSGLAHLERDSKQAPFSTIRLDRDVRIILENRGKIHCEKADFDFNALSGKLLPKQGELIHFSDLTTGPLSLSSQLAEIEFIKEDEVIKVSKIEAKEKVTVQYGNDFTLLADLVTFSNDVQPHLYATPNCLISHCEDRIQAEKVELFTDAKKAVLSSPKGNLKSSAFSNDQEVEFTCDELAWDQENQHLKLQGNVWVHDQGLGDLYCDEEIQLQQKQEGDKWILGQITAKGNTQLNYQLDADFKHLLVCHGVMRLDQQRLVLTLESPREKPIEYYHDQLKLLSDQAQMDYIQNNRTIHPQRLLLSGNVRLSSEEDNAEAQCAVADQFSYFPDDQKIILSSQESKKVLFWDAQQELSISADEVHIIRSAHGENIKGVGNVRFTFSSIENALLKKAFPFYQPKERY